MSFKKKSIRITIISFIVYALLVATHEGEYWPFSIYPMFSKAGQPWTRALVRDVSNTDSLILWKTTDIQNLIGEPVSMKEIGVDQIDYSNFVSKTKDWNPRRTQALRTMLGEQYLENRDWMIYKIHGKLVGEDSVNVKAVPHMLFRRDTTIFNPDLYNSVQE